jgi:hypothetical protein
MFRDVRAGKRGFLEVPLVRNLLAANKVFLHHEKRLSSRICSPPPNSINYSVMTSIERLEKLRNSLLDLHKALVEAERVSYEKIIGAIQSPNHFLQLLTTDPWFAWLHPLSQLIVAMDEALEEKESLKEANIETFVKQARLMLVPSEEGDGFSKHYYDALQADPGVVLAHGEVTKILTVKKGPV